VACFFLAIIVASFSCHECIASLPLSWRAFGLWVPLWAGFFLAIIVAYFPDLFGLWVCFLLAIVVACICGATSAWILRCCCRVTKNHDSSPTVSSIVPLVGSEGSSQDDSSPTASIPVRTPPALLQGPPLPPGLPDGDLTLLHTLLKSMVRAPKVDKGETCFLKCCKIHAGEEWKRRSDAETSTYRSAEQAIRKHAEEQFDKEQPRNVSFARILSYVNIFTYVHTHTHTYIYTQYKTCIYICIQHTHIQDTYINPHTHTYMCICI
jgi:hypothetical protein